MNQNDATNEVNLDSFARFIENAITLMLVQINNALALNVMPPVETTTTFQYMEENFKIAFNDFFAFFLYIYNYKNLATRVNIIKDFLTYFANQEAPIDSSLAIYLREFRKLLMDTDNQDKFFNTLADAACFGQNIINKDKKDIEKNDFTDRSAVFNLNDYEREKNQESSKQSSKTLKKEKSLEGIKNKELNKKPKPKNEKPVQQKSDDEPPLYLKDIL